MLKFIIKILIDLKTIIILTIFFLKYKFKVNI